MPARRLDNGTRAFCCTAAVLAPFESGIETERVKADANIARPGRGFGARPYNPCMLHSLQSLVEGAVMERATLLANHVISAEPIAMERLRRHAGSTLEVRFSGWPGLLPDLPTLGFRVTPAGLVEWLGDERPAEADLRVEVDASNPALALAQALAGARPKVAIAGDAGFAADVDWMIENLRWDVQDDLARIVGTGPAHEIARIARAAAAALRDAVRTLSGLVDKAAPPVSGGLPPR
jgi:ubiquinone biosynthesis protein UbiJ